MGKEKAAADWDVDQLENYPRRALQGFCKQVGIRANQKTVDLIAALRAYHYSFACSSSSEAESVVDEESSDRSHLSEHEQSELMEEEEEEQEEEHDEEEELHNDEEAEAQEEEGGAVEEEEEPHNDEEEEEDDEAEAEAPDDEEGEVDAEEEEHEEDEEDAEVLRQHETAEEADLTEKDESLDAVLLRNQSKAEPTGAEVTRKQGTNNDKMDVEHGDSIPYRATIVEEEHKKSNSKPETKEILSKKNAEPMSTGEVVVHQRRRSAFPHLDRLVGASSSSSSSSSLSSIPTNSRTVEQNLPLKPVDEPQLNRNEATQTETDREEALRRKYTEELEAMLEQQRAQYRSQLLEKQQKEDEKKEQEAKNEREREVEETRTTENVNNATKTKTKDWDKIHAKQFEKMDSIADYLQRKEKSSATHFSSSATKHNTSFTAAKSEKHVSSINNKKVLKRKTMTETAPSSSSKTEPQQLDQKTPKTKTECSTIPSSSSSSRLNRTVSSAHLSLSSKDKSCSSTNTSIIDATPSSTSKKLTSFASQRQLRTPGNPTPAVHRQRCNIANTTTPSSSSSKRALIVRDPREALLASAPRTPSTTNNQVTKHKLSYTPHKGPLPKFEWNPLSLAATSSTSSAASSSSASPLQKTMRKTATMIARASCKKDEMRRKLNSVGSKKKKEKREEEEDENHNKNKSNMEEEGKNESERKQSKTGLMRELKNRMTPIKQKIAGGERRGSKEKVFKSKDQKREQFLSKRLESRKETLSSKRSH
ncbi:Myelin transcription factor 1-like [Balamuthia mandrillaris]